MSDTEYDKSDNYMFHSTLELIFYYLLISDSFCMTFLYFLCVVDTKIW